tara:strand:- start:547 stop:699 length:153 start_codon:yes stop_codon:yes gene_type:complete
MAKTYTKAQAKRACDAVNNKLMKMYISGYLSLKDYFDMEAKIKRTKNKLK